MRDVIQADVGYIVVADQRKPLQVRTLFGYVAYTNVCYFMTKFKTQLNQLLQIQISNEVVVNSRLDVQIPLEIELPQICVARDGIKLNATSTIPHMGTLVTRILPSNLKYFHVKTFHITKLPGHL